MQNGSTRVGIRLCLARRRRPTRRAIPTRVEDGRVIINTGWYNITLFGPGPGAGNYTVGCQGGHANAIFVCEAGGLGSQELVLVFQNSLAGQSDPFVSRDGGHVFAKTPVDFNQAITAVSGSAIAATGVP